MISLKLFNGVLAKYIDGDNMDYSLLEYGIVIEPSALWALDDIKQYISQTILDENELNKGIHKSWKKIKESNRFELLLEQIKHYISTYGSNFEDEVYLPSEELDLPEKKDLKLIVIKGYSRDELIDKSMSLLSSGIALKEETQDDIMQLLVDQLDYRPSVDEIKNKEFACRLIDKTKDYPTNPVEFLRYLVFKGTNSVLLIKNDATIDILRMSEYDFSFDLENYDTIKLSQIFNRFKPLFLAMKANSNRKTKSIINTIARLSKKHHKPIVENPLNKATSEKLSVDDMGWLNNASIFFLFRVLKACHNRIEGQENFLYKIRNGKSWYNTVEKKNVGICTYNLNYIIYYLKKRINFDGKKFYFPDYIDYALPTSEKMFVGNIPSGSIYKADKLAVGVYWKNEWGARDLDLSALNVGGKVGWNAEYNQNDDIYFSGDITDAPDGAVEYLYFNDELESPSLIINNIYHGAVGTKFKLIIGRGDNVNMDYLLNPNNNVIQLSAELNQVQNIMGFVIPHKTVKKFIIMNTGSGNISASIYNSDNKTIKALYEEYSNPFKFSKLIKLLGGEVVKEKTDDVDYDFSVENLNKTSFISFFDRKEENL